MGPIREPSKTTRLHVSTCFWFGLQDWCGVPKDVGGKGVEGKGRRGQANRLGLQGPMGT